MSFPRNFVCSQKGCPSLLRPPPSPLKPNLSPKADYFHRNTSLKWSAESMRINTYITIMLNHAIRSFSTMMGVQGGGLDPSPLKLAVFAKPTFMNITSFCKSSNLNFNSSTGFVYNCILYL